MSEDGILLQIKVIPGASANTVVGLEGDSVKLKIAAPPEKGKANKEIIAFLSELIGIKKKNLVIEKGEKSRIKLVRIYGVKKDKVFEKLGLIGESRR